ncbi:MAG TPA: lysine--tRNA ligase [Candidatus Binatia bacterium]|nr:lysine--tRNA ligase [Candidatus Binatia bacterium]
MPDSGSDLLVARRRKLEALRARGDVLFPNDFVPDRTTAELRERFGEMEAERLEAVDDVVHLAGRIVGVRDFGKTAFFDLQDRTGRVQVYVKRGELGEAAFETYRQSDVGDIVAVEGRLFRSKAGELSVRARSFRILTKALRPLPEKWHGLADTEIRYRQRYLDLIANPDVAEVFRKRAAILQNIREFFAARAFIEVETPMMQLLAGGAAARPFVTHHNALDLDLYLRIAPELYLKRLVVGGFERVFELSRVFRNEGVSAQHNPEFTILEFYLAYADYQRLMEITEELFCELAQKTVGGLRLRWRDREIDLTPPWERLTLREAVRRHAGARDADLASEASLRAFAAARGLALNKDWGAGKVLLELFEAFAEEKLVSPTFVSGYPVEVSPLARRNSDDPDVAERFELYIAGCEMANAFSELNDPDDQRRRFEVQARAKAAGDEEAQGMDEDYVLALEHAMPPTAGEGVGVDRLVMMLTNQPSIRDVILFPLLRPPA